MIGRLRNFVVNIKREIKLYRLVIADKRTPWLARIFLIFAVGYLLSPIDVDSIQIDFRVRLFSFL